MHFLLVFAILYQLASDKFTSANRHIIWDIQDELKDLNATCPYKNTCKEGRTTDNLFANGCHCKAVCKHLDTCCADSPYNFVRAPKMRLACRKVDHKTYYMVDRCPGSDSVWQSLCQDEGKEDAMKITPVTSLFTRITYKNFFCFRCNELGEDFLYWDVTLGSSDYKFDETIDKGGVSASYDPTYETWVAPLGKGGILVPVALNIGVPPEISGLPEECKKDVISRCSESWNDTAVSDKCEAYMGIVYKKNENWDMVAYRNAHCALCNFEDLANMSCDTYRYAFDKVPFSFTHLLDVNRSDGDQVGKVRKCEKNFLWDPFAKKCRRLTCALPGYVVKDGKCTPP